MIDRQDTKRERKREREREIEREKTTKKLKEKKRKWRKYSLGSLEARRSYRIFYLILKFNYKKQESI